jgi:tetratricopeptide (TPR) repeat protein
VSQGSSHIDEITARFRDEDRRLRRLTWRLTLVPVIVGILVVSGAWLTVKEARRNKKLLDVEIDGLSTQRDQLGAEVAKLAKEIEARSALFRRYEGELPQQARIEAVKLQEGLEFRNEGEFGKAIEAYRQVITVNPENSLAYCWLGYAYLQQGLNTEAIASLRRSIEIDPLFADAHYNLAYALWKADRPDAAASELKQAFEIDPSLRARSHRDEAYKPLRDRLEVTAGLGSARSEEEKTWVQKGVSAAKRGRFQEAVGAYDRALAINPNNALVCNWRGYALYRNQQYEEAADTLRRAISLDPSYAEAHYNLSLALWRLGEEDPAAKAYDRAIELDPGFETVARQDPQSKGLRRYLDQHPG